MQPYRHILVAVDGSPIANHALQHAIALARELQAQLRIVHVVDTLSLDWSMEFAYMEESMKFLHESGQRILQAAVDRARAAGVTADSSLLEVRDLGQRVGELIAQAAATHKAELIVMGTHGRRGVSRLFLGSVAETVVRVAIPPVLLIRD